MIERGERTDLLAQVTGNVTVTLKVPKKERAMPFLRIKLKVSTLKKGHVEWATAFGAKTAAALRKQMEAHFAQMIEDPEYPTLSALSIQDSQTSESVRVLLLAPPRPREAA